MKLATVINNLNYNQAMTDIMTIAALAMASALVAACGNRLAEGILNAPMVLAKKRGWGRKKAYFGFSAGKPYEPPRLV